VSIIEVVAATPEATREVWRYVFGIDLSARVKAYWEPIDTPLQHLLSEVRRLRLGLKDALWLRIVDVRGALEARSYEVDDTLTFRLVDHFCDWNAGVWRIEVDGGKPRVAESDAAPDLALSARDLGATYLGGTSFTELALAGRVQELRPDALRRADALFHNAPAPWCPEVF
jgi:predicted acetyltransferase